MKKLLFAISTLAAMMAVSCNKEVAPAEVTGEEPEVYEVKIGMGGAITSEITELTKSGESNDQLIGINVLSCPLNGDKYTQYAFGLFDTSDIVVKLISGYKYKFEARASFNCKEIFIANGYNNAYRGPFGDFPTNGGAIEPMQLNNIFKYSIERCFAKDGWGYYPADLYYGENVDYVPSEGGSVTIDMGRVSFGLSISVQNLSAGFVTTNIQSIGDVIISFPSTSYYSLYSVKGYGDSYNKENYYETLSLSAEWTNSDNVTVPLGTANIKVMRNKLTKVKINANPPTTENVFSLQYSEDPLVDSEDDTYEIGGGEVIDTPVE